MILIVFQTRTVETSISTAMWWSRHVSVCTTTTRQPAVPPAHEWPTDSHNTGHSASPLSPGLRPLGGLTQRPEQALSPWAKHTDSQWRGQPRTWLWVNTDWTLIWVLKIQTEKLKDCKERKWKPNLFLACEEIANGQYGKLNGSWRMVVKDTFNRAMSGGALVRRDDRQNTKPKNLEPLYGL